MRKSLRGAALFATLFAFLPPGLLSQSTKPTPRQWKIIQETPIPDGPAGEISDQVVSPDSRRVAYKLEREGKFSVVVDGVTGNQYDAITDIVFSPDSRRLAYFAAFRGLPATFNPDLVLMKVGGWWTVVVDGVEGPFYANRGPESLRFSPDSQRLAYMARVHSGGEGVMAVANSKPSPDGRRISESAMRGGGVNGDWAVVVDGKPGDTYKLIAGGSPIFSPDSNRIAYGAKREDGRWVAIIDGIASSAYYGLTTLPVFSPDSRRVAFGVAQSPERFAYVIDGSVQPGDYDGIGDVVFSADSKRVAYEARRAGRWFVVVDGIPGMSYDTLHKDPNAFMADGNIVYGALRGKEWLVIRGSQESQSFEAIGALTFSTDHSRFAFVGLAGGAHTVVANGTQGGKFDGVTQPVFSQDGKRLAYIGLRGNRRYFVIDGKETEIANRKVSFLSFSPSGAHWAYATEQDGKLVIIVDGATVGTYDGLIKGSTLRFAGESRLNALVARGAKRLRVEISPSAVPRASGVDRKR